MNAVARSLALRVLHRRPAAAAGTKKQAAAAAAKAAYSTAERLAAYRYRSDAGYLLLPLVAVGAGTWLIATAATRYFMTPPRQGTTTTKTKTTVEGRSPEVAAASPTS